MHNAAFIALMACGVDNNVAGRIAKTYTIEELKTCSAQQLVALGLSKEAASRLTEAKRTPIPGETAREVLRRSAFTCCICRKPGLPVVLHHIDKWEKSHSHAPENLCVLCLNHHGEAHTHHELSRNLTPQMLTAAQKEWMACVAARGDAQKEEALQNVRQYQGRWDYFNLSYIYPLLDEYQLSFTSRYTRHLLDAGLLHEDETINASKLTTGGMYWLDFFDGNYLKLYIADMVNTIIGAVPVKFISQACYPYQKLTPGDLCLVDGTMFFKRLNKKTRGSGQTRRATCTIGDMKFVGEFDAWYCNSASSHSVHLTGRKTATQLCMVRGMEAVDGVNIIQCSIIGLGLNLTQPDWMQMLYTQMGQRTEAPTQQTGDALEESADFARAAREEHYCEFADQQCDFCKVLLKTQPYMIDGETDQNGLWAYMCPACYKLHGRGIGCGVGQLYARRGGRWLMVGGFPDSTEEELL